MMQRMRQWWVPFLALGATALIAKGMPDLVRYVRIRRMQARALRRPGAQANHISNQTRIYALRPEARSRLNTVCMVACFAGGAAGTYLGITGWTRWGWTGVCAVGAGMSLLALLALWLGTARGAVSQR